MHLYASLPVGVWGTYRQGPLIGRGKLGHIFIHTPYICLSLRMDRLKVDNLCWPSTALLAESNNSRGHPLPCSVRSLDAGRQSGASCLRSMKCKSERAEKRTRKAIKGMIFPVIVLHSLSNSLIFKVFHSLSISTFFNRYSPSSKSLSK